MASITTTAHCGAIAFELASPQNAVDTVLASIVNPPSDGMHVHFANAYSVALAEQDADLAKTFAAGTCFPDGKPVIWAIRGLHRSLAQYAHQVRGPSFFEELMRQGLSKGVRHYFLGSTPETLEKLSTQLAHRIPGLQIAGSSSPPFRPVSDDEWREELKRVEACGADVVWIGLGTPKQDLIAAKLNGFMPSTYICVGAAFDFSAGNLRHAPAWMQQAGLEWMYRFAQEPRRLWRRYLVGNSAFVAAVARQLLSRFSSARS